MANLLLGVRTTLYDFKRIKLDNVDLDTKIASFKIDVSKKANIPKESLELVYCGNILSDDVSLRASGIKPGVMVHVLKKKVKDTPNPTQPMSEANIQALVVAFRTLTFTPSYKTFLQKMCRPESIDNIVMTTPGLSQDPVAIAMIQDPELLVRMGDIETVRRIVEMHPALAEAANHIVATAHEEAVLSNIIAASTSTGMPQATFSDDDDMESSQSSDSAQPSVSRNQSFSAITPAQLAAALASASQHQGSSSSTAGAANGAGLASSGGSGEASSAITPEMVSFAMQRAMAVMDPTPRSEETSQSSSESRANNDFTEQMRQMRELGLTDDVVNFQALQVAGGNVHAAIDLVFSGAISSEHQ